MNRLAMMFTHLQILDVLEFPKMSAILELGRDLGELPKMFAHLQI